jgi:hypothetical protein
MFQLTKEEFDNLKFQFGTSSWGGTRKLKALEKKYDKQFAIVFEAIYKLMTPPKKEQRKLGFKREKE